MSFILSVFKVSWINILGVYKWEASPNLVVPTQFTHNMSTLQSAFNEMVDEMEDFASNNDGSPQFVTVEYGDALNKAADKIETTNAQLAEKIRNAVWAYEKACDEMQEVWAENVVRKTNKRVLIMTPLAVSAQTVAEATNAVMGTISINNTPLIGVIILFP